MKNKENQKESDDLRDVKKLLMALLLKQGVSANTVAKILGYKDHTAISKMMPVRELQK